MRSSPNLPASFHLSASMLALVALVGTHSSVEATAVSVSSLGIPTPIESSMAMYYQPARNVVDLCPPDYDGAYIAAGCESIIWCADGMLRFQAGCPEEGQLFDDTCLCCRDADEFECRVKEVPPVEVEEQATVAVEVVEEDTVEGDDSAAVITDGLTWGQQPVDKVASSICDAGFTGLTTNEDCTSISVCSNGALVNSMDCPTGTLFDDNSKKCVKWHRQFVCTKSQMEAGTVETVENSSECPRGASGLHPLTDCVGYSVCFLGTKLFETSCTTGTLFNVNTQQCERWHRGFVCGGTPASPTEEPAPEVQLEYQLPAAVSQEGICPDGLTGFSFTQTPDCKGASVCRNGVFKFAIDCEDGKLFDSEKGRCVKWHRKFVCGANTSTKAPTESPTRAPVSYVCPEDYTGMVATTGCRGSYVCRVGKYLMGPIACPSGMLFDEAMGTCVDRSPSFVCANSATEAGTPAQGTDAPTSSPVEKDAGPCRSGFTGLSPTEQCKGANVCRDGEFLMSMNCPNGSLFDASIQQCVAWYRSFVCGDVAEVSVDAVSTDAFTNEVELKGAGKGKKSEKEDIGPDEAKGTKGEKDDASKDSPDEVSMETVDPPVPSPTPPMRPRSQCPKGFTGLVPANEDCNSYIFCKRGKYDNQGVESCPEIFVFDFLAQECVMPYRSFECVYTILTTDKPVESIAQELIAQVMTGEETVSDGEEEIAQESLAKVEIQQSTSGNNIRA